MPPIQQVLDALTHAALPAVVAAAATFLLIAKLAPVRIASAAAAIALAAGFLAGNHFRGAIDYRLDSEQVLTPGDLGRAFVATFTPPSEEEMEGEYVLPPLPFYWIPWTTGLALLAGVVARRTPAIAAWPLRLAAVVLATALAVPSALREEAPWILVVFAAVVLASWFVLERVVRDNTPDRLRFGPAAAGSLAFFAASLVLLHAHSGRLTDVATILSAALGAIAAVACLFRTDAASVAPGVAVALPSLMLSGHQDTFSEVPLAAFALVAVAPLAFTPLLLPQVRHLESRKWVALTTVLAAAPAITAIVLAMRAESLSFD